MIRECTLDDYLAIQQICENDLGYSCDPTVVRTRLVNLDKEKQVIKQLQDEEDITFLKDPHVESINRIYTSYEERKKGSEVKKDAEPTIDMSLLQDVPNLNIGDLLTDDNILGGGFSDK